MKLYKIKLVLFALLALVALFALASCGGSGGGGTVQEGLAINFTNTAVEDEYDGGVCNNIYLDGSMIGYYERSDSYQIQLYLYEKEQFNLKIDGFNVTGIVSADIENEGFQVLPLEDLDDYISLSNGNIDVVANASFRIFITLSSTGSSKQACLDLIYSPKPL